jgi:hypothetical protein
LEFSRLFLSGAGGNIFKLLSSIGMRFSGVHQSASSELTTKVVDIGSDFRDGVLLARLLETCLPGILTLLFFPLFFNNIFLNICSLNFVIL